MFDNQPNEQPKGDCCKQEWWYRPKYRKILGIRYLVLTDKSVVLQCRDTAVLAWFRLTVLSVLFLLKVDWVILIPGGGWLTYRSQLSSGKVKREKLHARVKNVKSVKNHTHARKMWKNSRACGKSGKRGKTVPSVHIVVGRDSGALGSAARKIGLFLFSLLFIYK